MGPAHSLGAMGAGASMEGRDHGERLTSAEGVTLRRTERGDIAELHAFEMDAVSNDMAGTKPRDWETFRRRWELILADVDGSVTGVTPRVIMADGVMVGSVNVAPSEGRDAIGYRLARVHWGRGIATKAVALMLQEVGRRPLWATTDARNAASMRVLEKNGFAEISREWTPETARGVARETVTLVLR